MSRAQVQTKKKNKDITQLALTSQCRRTGAILLRIFLEILYLKWFLYFAS